MKQEYHRALEQICLSEEARARIISVLEQKERGLKRPRRRIGRLILVCAVLILLLLGTGAAGALFSGGYQPAGTICSDGGECAG